MFADFFAVGDCDGGLLLVLFVGVRQLVDVGRRVYLSVDVVGNDVLIQRQVVLSRAYERRNCQNDYRD